MTLARLFDVRLLNSAVTGCLTLLPFFYQTATCAHVVCLRRRTEQQGPQREQELWLHRTLPGKISERMVLIAIAQSYTANVLVWKIPLNAAITDPTTIALTFDP